MFILINFIQLVLNNTMENISFKTDRRLHVINLANSQFINGSLLVALDFTWHFTFCQNIKVNSLKIIK